MVTNIANGISRDESKIGMGQQLKNRCTICKRKVGIVGFECKCSLVFCALHRYPNDHSCKFDFKSQYQDYLRRNNPPLEIQKMEKI